MLNFIKSWKDIYPIIYKHCGLHIQISIHNWLCHWVVHSLHNLSYSSVYGWEDWS